MKYLLLTTAICLSAITLPTTAKNTADDWKWLGTYYQTYGEWTTACEDRADDANIKRCYLRYVDAYAQEPFGAMFVFVTILNGGPRFAFEFERGTAFNSDWTVQAGNEVLWAFNPGNCPIFGECIIEGRHANNLAKILAAPGATLNFAFVDRQNRSFERSWPGDHLFADAFRDLQQQTTDRVAN